MEPVFEGAVNRWHAAVNGGEPGEDELAATDPVVVPGPKGAGPVAPGEFAEWVQRPVATLFRITGDRISAASRLPGLNSALGLARSCHEKAVTG